MTGTVTKQGNGAHIMVPKEWIGKQVKVIPVGNIEQTSDIENMTKGKGKK
jgi:hypothetical protein